MWRRATKTNFVRAAILLLLSALDHAHSYCWQAGKNPGFSRPPNVMQLEEDKVRVSWEGALVNEECADNYVVKYWRNVTPDDYKVSPIVPKGTHSADVEVTPRESYSFQAVAREEKGVIGGVDWNKSPVVRFKTTGREVREGCLQGEDDGAEVTFSGPPAVRQEDLDVVVLTWALEEKEEGVTCGRTMVTRVRYWPKAAPENATEFKARARTGEEGERARVRPAEPYVFQISLSPRQRGREEEILSPPAEFTTKPTKPYFSAPPTVKRVAAREGNSSVVASREGRETVTVRVSWGESLLAGHLADFLEVIYEHKKESWPRRSRIPEEHTVASVPVGAGDTHADVEVLANEGYEFKMGAGVRAADSDNRTSFEMVISPSATFTAFSCRDNPPKLLRPPIVRKLGPGLIRARWLPPANEECADEYGVAWRAIRQGPAGVLSSDAGAVFVNGGVREVDIRVHEEVPWVLIRLVARIREDGGEVAWIQSAAVKMVPWGGRGASRVEQGHL